MTSLPLSPYGDAQLSASSLLSLPGELRNRIYNYCVEPGSITLHSAHRQHRHRPYPIPFWSLRHVCRLLYNEFTPIYLAKTMVTLQPSDVERYIAVFYSTPSSYLLGETLSSNFLIPKVHGNIMIHISLGQTLDLTSVAGLLSRAPNVRIRLARGAASSAMMKDGIKLLDSITSGSCSIDFENTVERMLFRYSVRAELVVKFQQGIQYGELLDQTPERNARSWLVQQGLPVMSALKVVMEGSEGVVRDDGRSMNCSRETSGDIASPNIPHYRCERSSNQAPFLSI